jgi:hypothetical protein
MRTSDRLPSISPICIGQRTIPTWEYGQMLLEESNHENKIDKNNNHNKHNDKEKTP